jgi:hypothetical protein
MLPSFRQVLRAERNSELSSLEKTGWVTRAREAAGCVYHSMVKANTGKGSQWHTGAKHVPTLITLGTQQEEDVAR